MNLDTFLNNLNSILAQKGFSLQFTNIEELTDLSYEDLSFLFYKLSDFSEEEGVNQNGELNELGHKYDEVCTILSLEMMRRPEFQFDDPTTESSAICMVYERLLR